MNKDDMIGSVIIATGPTGITWTGTIIGLIQEPAMIIQQADGSRITLPQKFKTELASRPVTDRTPALGDTPPPHQPEGCTTMTSELFELVTWADIRPGDQVWYLDRIHTITREPIDIMLSPGWKEFPMQDKDGGEYIAGEPLTGSIMRLVPQPAGNDDTERARVMRAAVREHLKNIVRENKRFALELTRIEETYARQARQEPTP